MDYVTVTDALNARHLPDLTDREAMKEILLEEEYGKIPESDIEVTFSTPRLVENRICEGKVSIHKVTMTVKANGKSHEIPFLTQCHTDGIKRPFFVFLNFRWEVPDLYLPAEEISENGFDLFCVCYGDITKDNSDFTSGLASVLLPNGQKNDFDAGKIRLWAWAASRILDYALTLPGSLPEGAAVIGHSRLGKTALVAGLTDERFQFVFSNDSGCSGASLSRKPYFFNGETVEKGKENERIQDIVKNFPFWFCKRYHGFQNTGYAPDFDQHELLAAIAPRYVYVASAIQDDWAEPMGEFLSCVAASPVFEEMGVPGLVYHGKFPEIGKPLNEGHIGYHFRNGLHFLSRADWQFYMAYIKRQLKLI